MLLKGNNHLQLVVGLSFFTQTYIKLFHILSKQAASKSENPEKENKHTIKTSEHFKC